MMAKEKSIYLMVYMLRETILVLLASLLGLAILLGSYGILRFLSLPVRQIVVFIGILLLCVCGMFSVLILTNSQTTSSFGIFALTGNVAGSISFLVAIYALSQWIARGCYLLVKKRVIPRWARHSRSVLLFLREHHRFFGWIVLATATAHALYFLPVMTKLPLSEVLLKSGVVSGIMAWCVLVFLVLLGLWIEIALKHKRLAKKARFMHIAVALIFLGSFVAHFIVR